MKGEIWFERNFLNTINLLWSLIDGCSDRVVIFSSFSASESLLTSSAMCSIHTPWVFLIQGSTDSVTNNAWPQEIDSI